MKKLLCFTTYPPEAPSVYHRIEAYRLLLEQQNIRLQIISFLTPSFYARRRQFGFGSRIYKIVMFLFCFCRMLIYVPKAAMADTVIIHREVFPIGSPWLEQLISWISPKCYYDIDDAIWFPPSNPVNQRALLWNQDRVPNIMNSVDGVIAGSPYIENYACKYNRQVINIPTPYDDLQGPLNPEKQRQKQDIVIVWIGNLGNAYYIRQILPALQALNDNYNFVLRLIGGHDIYDIQDRVINIEYKDWSRSAEQVLLPQSDIGIMPLTDQSYEQGKCAFKIIQYMSAGLPIVASPVGMNRQVVTPDTGMLATTTEEWHRALGQLLASSSLRYSLGEASYKKYQENFSRTVCAGRLAEIV